MFTTTTLSMIYKRLIRALLGCLASCAIASCAIASCTTAPCQIPPPCKNIAGDPENVSGLLGNELKPKTLSLTFDDGPAAGTSEIAKFLAQLKIPATFFINGKNANMYPDAIRDIIDGGHVLANHTQNHTCMLFVDAEIIVKEITETDVVILKAQPNGPFYFRAPWGAYSLGTLSAIHASPMKKYVSSIFWDMGGQYIPSVSAQDAACWAQNPPLTVAECGDLYLNEINNATKNGHGGIILVHDSHPETIKMLELIIPQLQKNYYNFVPLADVPSVQRALLVQPQNIHEFTAPNPAGDGPRYLYSASRTPSPGWSAVENLKSTPELDGELNEAPGFLGDLTPAAGSIPVYSYHALVSGIGWKQMLSTNAAVGQGWTRDAMTALFYAFPTAGLGRTPLHSFYRQNSPGWNFRYSLSPTLYFGETSFGIIAYVPAN
jgi:peptidoglycan/xylan/chitin deacetylase (PgdA/CDA1 family)